MSTPLDTNYTRIANEILEALAACELTTYEWRVLMVLFRYTYGYQRKEATLTPAQVAEQTGMSRPNVCRSWRKLQERNIVVRADNVFSFNKYHTQWRALSARTMAQGVAPLSVETTNVVRTGNADCPPGQQTLSVQATQTPKKPQQEAKSAEPKEKKENFKESKERPSEMNLTREQLEGLHVEFDRAALQHCATDEPYLQKLWPQGMQLTGDSRKEFLRKVSLVVRQCKMGHPAALKMARRVYNEICGYVNDFGEMQRKLSAAEVARRNQFAEEEYGKKYVENELNPSPKTA